MTHIQGYYSVCAISFSANKQIIRKEQQMKVHNINGTSDNKCRCGSWEAHWEKFNEYKRSWPKYCSESTCLERASVGAHVQKEAGTNKWYIIPLCAKHNGPKFHGESIEVSASTSFAPANRKETCEK